jgi:hypothetical protein
LPPSGTYLKAPRFPRDRLVMELHQKRCFTPEADILRGG